MQNMGSGYLDIFRGTSERKPQYKKYTLNDFKNLRNIASMGGLGPDFESEAFRQEVSCSLGVGIIKLSRGKLSYFL